MKKQSKKTLTFESAFEFYTEYGLSVEVLDLKTEFSIQNVGEHSMPVGRLSPVYRSNFFSFAFYKDADGIFFVDGEEHPIKDQLVCFTNPGHLRQFRLDRIRTIYFITLSESFLKENVHSEIFDKFPFLLSEKIWYKYVEQQQFEEFEDVCLQIEKAYSSGSQHKYMVIGHLFVVLLIKIKEVFWPDYDPVKENDRAAEIVRRFKLLLEQHYRDLSKGRVEKMYRVTEYASLLNLHPNYLNTLVRAKTGKSIGNWISEKTITEAKALLRHSDLSVKEISYRLGFAEIQHFSAYFKKHTNLTPGLYRQDT